MLEQMAGLPFVTRGQHSYDLQPSREGNYKEMGKQWRKREDGTGLCWLGRCFSRESRSESVPFSLRWPYRVESDRLYGQPYALFAMEDVAWPSVWLADRLCPALLPATGAMAQCCSCKEPGSSGRRMRRQKRAGGWPHR